MDVFVATHEYSLVTSPLEDWFGLITEVQMDARIVPVTISESAIVELIHIAKHAAARVKPRSDVLRPFIKLPQLDHRFAV